jgi:hypothetical protein
MKFYYFIYYSFYKFWDYISNPRILSDFKSVITIGFIKILILLSFLYYTNIVLPKIQLIIIALVFIIIPNVYLFIYNNKWKEYFIEFELYSVKKKRKYFMIIFFGVALIIVNFIISLNYFLSIG